MRTERRSNSVGCDLTRFAPAGRSEDEIATITGYGLREVAAMLDAADPARDSHLADVALGERAAYEAGPEASKRTPNRSRRAAR